MNENLMNNLRKPSMARRFQLLSLASVVALSLTPLFAVPSFAGSKATLSATQIGNNIEVRWSLSNAKPSTVDIKLVQGGEVTKAVRVKASLRKVTLKGVETGAYTLQLTSAKPKLNAKKNITVFGAPKDVSELTFKRNANTITTSWLLPDASRLNPVEYIEFSSTVNGVTNITTLPADAIVHALTVEYPSSTYVIAVRTLNRYGASAHVSVSVMGVDDARSLTTPRLITQSGAEEVFGSFALMNRSPLGPVDLESSMVAAENPALQALQKCITTGSVGRADILGLPNVGGVWASRNSTGTMILTSGVSILLARSGLSWIETNPGISTCASPALHAQLNAVALQLSAAAKTEGVSAVKFDGSIVGSSLPEGTQGMLLQGKIYLNGGTSGEVAQSIQLIWIVVGDAEALSQYILIRVGTPIDEALSTRLFAQVKTLNN